MNGLHPTSLYFTLISTLMQQANLFFEGTDTLDLVVLRMGIVQGPADVLDNDEGIIFHIRDMLRSTYPTTGDV